MTLDDAYRWFRETPNALDELLEMKCKHEGMKRGGESMTKEVGFRTQFAENLRDARLEIGLTQRQLAQRVGTTFQLISAYENAKRLPMLDAVVRLADALVVPLDELVPGIDYAMRNDDVIKGQTTIYDIIEEDMEE